jgi:CRISPR-associated Csx3 family protein
MENIKLQSFNKDEGLDILSFKIVSPDGVVTPSDMKQMKVEFASVSNTLVIEGKGPIWVYARLVALAVNNNYTKIATYDPRLSGAVIVYAVNDKENLGTVIPVAL